MLTFTPSAVFRRSAGLAAAALLLCCASEESAVDRGDVVQRWEPIEDAEAAELAAAIEERTFFDAAVAIANAHLKLPRDVTVVHRTCGRSTAVYRGGEMEIWLCYEKLLDIAELAREPAGGELTAPSEAVAAARTISTWLFIFFHELGHAVIDLFDLPVLGKEEDAADEFAALMLLHTRGVEVTQLAAGYWNATSQGRTYDAALYADEHSLDVQRYYAILCLTYGSDPEGQQQLVGEELLSPERAQECPREYGQTLDAWHQLLGPWLASSLGPGLDERL